MTTQIPKNQPCGQMHLWQRGGGFYDKDDDKDDKDDNHKDDKDDNNADKVDGWGGVLRWAAVGEGKSNAAGGYSNIVPFGPIVPPMPP